MKTGLARQAADLAIQKFGGTENSKKAFLLVIEFLGEFPERLSLRSKKLTSDSLDFYIKLSDKFFKARPRVDGPKPPEKIPDDRVTYILGTYFDISQPELDSLGNSDKV